VIVVDDHLLLAVLVGRAGAAVPPFTEADDVFTTGSWYYRLARAVHDPAFTGALSRRVTALDPEMRRGVIASLDELPPEVGVLSPRVLVPVMAALSEIGHFNHLHAEGLATALVLPAGLRVTVASELLRSACSRLHINLTVSPA
jgi:hypothetical protein